MFTCNFAEAIDSAGGQITDENGKPNVNTPGALMQDAAYGALQ